MTEIEQLLADLRAADVGSRELSDRVNELFGWRKTTSSDVWNDPQGGIVWDNMRPNPTMYITDALGLYPMSLNEWHDIEFHNLDGPGCFTTKVDEIEGKGATVELALTIAVVEAEQAKRAEAMNELQRLGQEYDGK